MFIPTEDDLASARARCIAANQRKLAASEGYAAAVQHETKLVEAANAARGLVEEVVAVFLERGYRENRTFYNTHVRKTLEQVSQDGAAITVEVLYERTKRMLQERRVLAGRPFLKEAVIVCHSRPSAW